MTGTGLNRWVALGVGVLAGLAPAAARAQGLDPVWGEGAMVPIGDEGTLRITGFGRAWLRVAEQNPDPFPPPDAPGPGEEDDVTVDAGLREARALLLAVPVPELTLGLGAGVLDLVPGSRGGTVALTDAWADVAVVGDALHLGAGLHPWAGLAREATVGEQAPLGLEPLALAEPLRFAGTDAFDRRLGGFAHGRGGPVAWRLAASRAFAGDPERERTGTGSAFLDPGGRWLGDARVVLELLGGGPADVTPYVPGTWRGSVSSLALGVGGLVLPDGAAVVLDPDTLERSRRTAWVAAADLFVDVPLDRGASVTGYVLYLYEDLGPDALRLRGSLDVPEASSVDDLSFSPVGGVVAGTGHHLAATVGTMLPGRFGGTRIEPWAKGTLSLVDAVGDPVVGAEAGLTWHVFDPYLRLTLAWRMRGGLRRVSTVDAPTPSPFAAVGQAHAGVLQVLTAF